MQELSYVYDEGGNILTITDDFASETQAFVYDALNRLTGVSNAYVGNYGYNVRDGNLESMNGATYVYEAQVTCGSGTRTLPHAVSLVNTGTMTNT